MDVSASSCSSWLSNVLSSSLLLPPSPCPLCSHFGMIFRRSDRIDARHSAIFCDEACCSPLTFLYAQSVSSTKLEWHCEAGAKGLKSSEFHSLQLICAQLAVCIWKRSRGRSWVHVNSSSEQHSAMT
jgi:hypothetical protein